MKRAALYVRVSTDPQTVENQKKARERDWRARLEEEIRKPIQPRVN